MPEADKKLITITVPVLNEEENIQPFYEAVSDAIAPLKERYRFEFLFTDNHSTDSTFEKLASLAEADDRIRVLRFSRDYGFQRSVYTGLVNAAGDAAIQIDCDLQDPPEMIPRFIDKWEQGYQNVFGIRISRQENRLKTGMRRFFYRLIDLLSEDRLPHDAGDFRLVDRKILDALKQFNDYQPYLRGEIAAMGFSQAGIEYERPGRQRGKSKFKGGDMIKLALDGILNHSVIPLRIATFIGLIVSVLTFLGIIGYLVGNFYFGADWPAGFATITIFILLAISLNALFLGIIGEYLGRIYQQVKKRPLVIVEREIGSSRGPGDSANERKMT
ncbi:MAG: glycosyltransferase family 2 protein [Thermoleophilia bacterium]|nr:glycosyltransferase family 2 protein [Thermoleophilia bacterium]